MNLFLTFALLSLSLWRAKAQIIPLTVSGAENRLDWREAVAHCWNEYKVSGLHPCVSACMYACVHLCVHASDTRCNLH